MADLIGLKFREKALQGKIERLKSGEIVAEIHKDDGRQEEAIKRAEKHLREVKKEIAEHTKGGTSEAKKETK